jgi:integrase
MKGGAGTWIARAYDDEQCKYRLKALGSFAQQQARERFTLAKQAAESFAADVERGGLPEETIVTVADACRKFAEGRSEDEARFRRFIYADPIGSVKLTKLRKSHVEQWRMRIAETPARVSRRKKGKQTTRKRSPATLNRDMAALRTALGKVMALGRPGSEGAWQEALRPIKNAVRRRTLYLTRDERGKLLKHIDPEAEPFVRALCLLPLRPGAVAALSARDFDPKTSELTIVRDKAGEGRRIVVPEFAAELFSRAADKKRPNDPLFTRANGTAWDKNSWKIPISTAARAANLPAGTTAYTLRHSTITDLVGSGLPLLTIAQISGTSAEMIEKHYGHLVRHAAVEALASLAL